VSTDCYLICEFQERKEGISSRLRLVNPFVGGADIAVYVCVPDHGAHTLKNDVCATRAFPFL
jgi:hypothetical protein